MVNLLVRSLCTILIGVLMIILREAFMPVIVQFIGAAFIVSGVISLFNVYMLHKRGLSKGFDAFVLVTVGAAALFLGAWLLLSPAFFLSLLMLVLGVLLLAMGGYQFVMLLAMQRRLHLSLYRYVVPLLLLAMGVVVVVNPFEAAAIPFLVVGVGAVLAGVSDLVNTLYLIRRSRTIE